MVRGFDVAGQWSIRFVAKEGINCGCLRTARMTPPPPIDPNLSQVDMRSLY
jgi:hypothetical protein